MSGISIARLLGVLAVANSLLLSSCATHNPRLPPSLSAADLRVEYQLNPLGIDTRLPRLSWQLKSDARGTLQVAYQIRVFETTPDSSPIHPLLWDSGRVTSRDSIQVFYAGPPLHSGGRYDWQVRVWDNSGRESTWSEAAWWEMGLLAASEWQARWIRRGDNLSSFDAEAVPLLRRAFTLRGEIIRARIYVTSHGLYQLYLNGRRVGEAELTPGWTSYNKRLQYQTYDVTAQVRSGENALGAMLGAGWYQGSSGLTEPATTMVFNPLCCCSWR